MKMICIRNDGYEHCLTIGKEYELTEIGEILQGSPLVEFIGDKGKKHWAHLSRFK